MTAPQSRPSRPAMARSRVDLPEPLGPSSAVSDPGGDLEADVVERGEVAVVLAGVGHGDHRVLLLRSSRVISSSVDEGDAHQQGGRGVRAEGVVVVDVAGVDEQGQGLRHAREAGGHHDHGAELAERAGDGEHDAVGQAPADRRQGDPPEGLPARRRRAWPRPAPARRRSRAAPARPRARRTAASRRSSRAPCRAGRR